MRKIILMVVLAFAMSLKYATADWSSPSTAQISTIVKSRLPKGVTDPSKVFIYKLTDPDVNTKNPDFTTYMLVTPLGKVWTWGQVKTLSLSDLIKDRIVWFAENGKDGVLYIFAPFCTPFAKTFQVMDGNRISKASPRWSNVFGNEDSHVIGHVVWLNSQNSDFKVGMTDDFAIKCEGETLTRKQIEKICESGQVTPPETPVFTDRFGKKVLVSAIKQNLSSFFPKLVWITANKGVLSLHYPAIGGSSILVKEHRVDIPNDQADLDGNVQFLSWRLDFLGDNYSQNNSTLSVWYRNTDGTSVLWDIFLK